MLKNNIQYNAHTRLQAAPFKNTLLETSLTIAESDIKKQWRHNDVMKWIPTMLCTFALRIFAREGGELSSHVKFILQEPHQSIKMYTHT